MPQELLDIVDADDNVIGQMPFKKAHEAGALHRFTRVLLQNSRGDFVLQVRAAGIPDAGKIDAPGGHVQSGEDYLEGAVRELQEEMGVYVEPEAFTLLGRIEDMSRSHIENMIGKAYVAVHDGPYTIEEEELTEIKLFKADEILELVQKSPDKISPKLLQCLKLWERLNA
tara:strand:- start:216272 stop:216781 length:510 start_codon:yes stop_codon:yes gene_type:complete